MTMDRPTLHEIATWAHEWYSELVNAGFDSYQAMALVNSALTEKYWNVED